MLWAHFGVQNPNLSNSSHFTAAPISHSLDPFYSQDMKGETPATYLYSNISCQWMILWQQEMKPFKDVDEKEKRKRKKEEEKMFRRECPNSVSLETWGRNFKGLTSSSNSRHSVLARLVNDSLHCLTTGFLRKAAKGCWTTDHASNLVREFSLITENKTTNLHQKHWHYSYYIACYFKVTIITSIRSCQSFNCSN